MELILLKVESNTPISTPSGLNILFVINKYVAYNYIMNWQNALDRLNYILNCPSKDPDFIELGTDFVESGIKYANIRARWYLLDLESQDANNSERTKAHKAFIDSCNALSRIMAKLDLDISWRKDLGNDRRDIGDFACYLHALVAIKSR